MIFDDWYRKFSPEIRVAARTYSRSTKVPMEDFVSAMNEALWKSFSAQPDGPTEEFTRKSLRNAALNIITRRHGTYYRRVYATLDKPADEDTPMSETADAETTEDVVFRRANVRRAHQLELIRSLIDKADSPTISLVEAFLAAPPDAKRTQIAKSAGLHHKVADDKLRKLARRYDANRFGEIYEYLAV